MKSVEEDMLDQKRTGIPHHEECRHVTRPTTLLPLPPCGICACPDMPWERAGVRARLSALLRATAHVNVEDNLDDNDESETGTSRVLARNFLGTTHERWTDARMLALNT